MDWLERLKYLKSTTNETYKSISEKTNIPQTTIEKLFTGRTKDPKLNMMRDIVHCLGYKLDDLINESKFSVDIKIDDSVKQLIIMYDKLNTIGKQMANEYINLLLLDGKYLKLPDLPPESEYEQAAWGGRDTKGTIPKTIEETTARR